MKSNLKEMTVKIPIESWKIGYLAGLIDGEGTVGLYKHAEAFEKIRPRFFVTNNSEVLMLWLKNTFGGAIRRHGNGYRWSFWAIKDVQEILKPITPFLLIKKENAKKVLSYCEKNIQAHRDQ